MAGKALFSADYLLISDNLTMHICFITDEYPQEGKAHGGVGTFVYMMANSLAAKGIRVSVLGGGEEDQNFTAGNVHIYQIHNSKWRMAKFINFYSREGRLLRQIHRQYPLDVVEGSELSFCFLPKIKGVKNIIRLHGGHHFFTQLLGIRINHWRAWQEKRSFRRTDYFIGVTQFVINGTRKYLPIPEAKATVIGLPVDCTKFYQSDDSKIIPFKIVFAGTIAEKKGIRQLIMAMPAIKAHFPVATLDVYGRDWKTPDGLSYLQYLKTFVEDSVKDNIVFKGAVPHDALPVIYETAHLCAFPSHMETQGMVVLETMSMGKAVLFSTAGPGPETIDHLKDGLLANPYSPEDIAAKINYLFARPGLEKEWGKAARQKMLSRFDIPVVTAQNMILYEKITGIQMATGNKQQGAKSN